MKQIRYSIIICVLSFIFCLDAYAMPALRRKAVLRQPDGTEFTAILKGDEFFHLLTTADGNAIIQEEDGYYCYAVYDTDGKKKSTGHRVGASTPASVLASSRSIPYQKLMANAARQRGSIMPDGREPLMKRLANAKGMLTKAGESGPAVKHGIVILAQFKEDPKDIYAQFTTPDVKASFENLLRQQGYTGPDNKATGSAKDYFDAQFEGKYEFHFDVFGPVTLSRSKSYYGGNDSDDSDSHPEEMVIEACRAIDNEVDFSLYDDDNDGEVDNVYVFFAGGDEAQYAGDNCIWSHAWYIKDGAGKNLTLDGVRINRYACSSELRTTELDSKNVAVEFTFTGIGTFCHEYSHTLGLPDFYDTDYEESGGTADALWMNTSLMDGGGYNNDGNTPPNYNVIEREMLGLTEIVDLSYSGSPITISPIETEELAYRIPGDVTGEYYLMECRNTAGWDKNIYEDSYGNSVDVGTGTMLIYHVDKSSNASGRSESYRTNLKAYERWQYNEVNANPKHECADLIEATSSAKDVSQVFFPQAKATSFTPQFWNRRYSDLVLTDITGNSDGTVTFSVRSTNTSKETKVEAFQDRAIISWKSNMDGYKGDSHIKIGDRTFDVQRNSDGIYSIIIAGLGNSSTSYKAQIYFEDENTFETVEFSCTRHREGTYPFIFLKNTERNSDGSFVKGTKVPLIVCNAIGVDETGTSIAWFTDKPKDSGTLTWYFNDKQIERESDGYYTINESGVLKAVIDLTDGGKDTIIKEITVK